MDLVVFGILLPIGFSLSSAAQVALSGFGICYLFTRDLFELHDNRALLAAALHDNDNFALFAVLAGNLAALGELGNLFVLLGHGVLDLGTACAVCLQGNGFTLRGDRLGLRTSLVQFLLNVLLLNWILAFFAASRAIFAAFSVAVAAVTSYCDAYMAMSES